MRALATVAVWVVLLTPFVIAVGVGKILAERDR